MGLKRISLTVVSDGSQNADSETDRITGYLEEIRYVKAAALNYTDGVDFTITGKSSGQNLWTQSNVNASVAKIPRKLAQDVLGADLTGVYNRPLLIDEAVRIQLAQAGASKTGLFEIIVSDV
jgi:hypothetical protein